MIAILLFTAALTSPVAEQPERLSPTGLAAFYVGQRDARDRQVRETYGSTKPLACERLKTHLAMIQDLKTAKIDGLAVVVDVHDNSNPLLIQKLNDEDIRALDAVEQRAEAQVDLMRLRCARREY
jgi:hypothetical protein